MNDNKPLLQERAIYSREELCGNYFILWIWDEVLGKKCRPGQFFELRAHASLSDPDSYRCLPKLFKPISIYDNAGGRIGFFIKNVGQGTASLARLKAGDMLELLGPLGNGFPIVAGRRILMVSGGIGYPPLWYLQKELINHNLIFWLHGGASQNDIFPCDDVWTVDGSIGNQGLVTDGIEKLLETKQIDLICSCGPIPMLKQTAAIASRHGIEHYASLEAYMACGIGVCHGCAVPVGTKDQWTYQRVCKEGPVFNASDILWELL